MNGASSVFGIVRKLGGTAQKWSKQLWKRFRKEEAVHDEKAATTTKKIAEEREVVKILQVTVTYHRELHGCALEQDSSTGAA